MFVRPNSLFDYEFDCHRPVWDWIWSSKALWAHCNSDEVLVDIHYIICSPGRPLFILITRWPLSWCYHVSCMYRTLVLRSGPWRAGDEGARSACGDSVHFFERLCNLYHLASAWNSNCGKVTQIRWIHLKYGRQRYHVEVQVPEVPLFTSGVHCLKIGSGPRFLFSPGRKVDCFKHCMVF